MFRKNNKSDITQRLKRRKRFKRLEFDHSGDTGSVFLHGKKRPGRSARALRWEFDQRSNCRRWLLRRQRWEELCNRCGACCYEKRESGLFRLYTDYTSPCRFLDRKTKQCAVYEIRFTACDDCRKMTVFHALFAAYLPETCGYVRYYRRPRNYKK